MTSGEKKHLRGLAMALDPHLTVGREGITPALVEAFAAALAREQVVKVRFLEEERGARKALVQELAAAGLCELVGSVGKTAAYASGGCQGETHG